MKIKFKTKLTPEQYMEITTLYFIAKKSHPILKEGTEIHLLPHVYTYCIYVSSTRAIEIPHKVIEKWWDKKYIKYAK